MNRFVVTMLAVLIASTAFARNDGRYATNPDMEKWFDGLVSRKGPCCSNADGTALSDTEWDTKDKHYRVYIEDKWWDVPDEAVITEPNRVGRTMVWPMYERWYDGSHTEQRTLIQIRCFMPGSMT